MYAGEVCLKLDTKSETVQLSLTKVAALWPLNNNAIERIQREFVPSNVWSFAALDFSACIYSFESILFDQKNSI